MDDIALALKELGEKNGLAIALDANGACTLELEDGRMLCLQERANLNELDFVAILGEVPETARAEVFTDLLSANFYWKETLGATLSWNADLEQVVLIYPFPLADATPASLEAIFTRFLELQAAWKDRLEELVAAAGEDEGGEEDEEADDEERDGPAGNEDLIINP
ncbi:MAG: type III secretion system chaperone [Kiritimatiellae bacterium]|nr:type III secretion system chaperone [Kiritimatiellia bacterium]